MNARTTAALRRSLSGHLLERGFRGISRLARLHPAADPARHGVEVIADVAWREGGSRAARLDVYRPVDRAPRAVVLYLHGGGFRILSKDTHWGMAMAFARRGYTVLVPNYRLAPKNPYPAAVVDACEALRWTLDHAERYGADPARLVLAGESAGANLVTALAIAASTPRPEPWARHVFDRAPRIAALLPACGLFQVSDPRRLGHRGWVQDRIDQISADYLDGAPEDVSRDLCDVVVTLERDEPFERPLPPTFLVVGGADPIAADGGRLERALSRRGVDVTAKTYPGGIHAFHAFLWTRLAREAWRDQHAFLDRVLGDG